MGGAYGKYVGEDVCIRGFSVGNLREREHLVDLAVNGRHIKQDQQGDPG